MRSIWPLSETMFRLCSGGKAVQKRDRWSVRAFARRSTQMLADISRTVRARRTRPVSEVCVSARRTFLYGWSDGGVCVSGVATRQRRPTPSLLRAAVNVGQLRDNGWRWGGGNGMVACPYHAPRDCQVSGP